MDLSQKQLRKHNRLYRRAWKMISGEIHLDGRELPHPGWFARWKLRRAKALFERAIHLNPCGWNAMVGIAKIEQRLGRHKESLDWLLHAREFNQDNTGVAKEAALTASELGDQTLAIKIVEEAIRQNPGDPALRVNSGLAYILSGDPQSALQRFQEAAEMDPQRRINKALAEYTKMVMAKKIPLPLSATEIVRNLPEY